MKSLPEEWEQPNYLNRLTSALASIRECDIQALADRLIKARAEGQSIFIVGNGGSAATASHMATDLGVGSARYATGIRAISLVDNVSVLTATGNDISFDDVFAAQIRLLGNNDDVLIAISASGNSPNVLCAVEAARALKMTVVALSGFDGGALATSADISIRVVTDIGDYGPVEDAHLAINHMITELIRRTEDTGVNSRQIHE